MRQTENMYTSSMPECMYTFTAEGQSSVEGMTGNEEMSQNHILKYAIDKTKIETSVYKKLLSPLNVKLFTYISSPFFSWLLYGGACR